MSDTGPSKTVHNEQLKLRATAPNGLAIAAVVAGFVTPLAAMSFGISAPVAGGGILTIAISLAWLAGGLLLHLGATSVLGGLRE